MDNNSNILAMIDGSIYSKSVCDHTAWVANRVGASVNVVHALGRRQVSSEPSNFSGSIGLGARTALLDELAELDRQKAKLAKQRGKALLEDSKAHLAEAGVESIDTKLRIAEIVETVLELEEAADLVVIGKRGEGADFDKLHLGSNLERVARASKKPVLVASREFKPIKKMLIAFDGGSSVGKAVDYLSKNPMFKDIECQLLTAGSDSTDTRRNIEGAAATLKEVGYSVTTAIKPGDAEAVIASTIKSDGFDLLVIGAYGRSRIRDLIIGSTTTVMMRECQVPVILVR